MKCLFDYVKFTYKPKEEDIKRIHGRFKYEKINCADYTDKEFLQLVNEGQTLCPCDLDYSYENGIRKGIQYQILIIQEMK